MNRRKLKKEYKKAVCELLSLTYGTVRRTYLAEFYREYGSTWFKSFPRNKVFYQIKHDSYNPKYFLKEDEWEKYDLWRDKVLEKPCEYTKTYHSLKKKDTLCFFPGTTYIVELCNHLGGNV